jgi:8-oxo-dGTP diphosphatase
VNNLALRRAHDRLGALEPAVDRLCEPGPMDVNAQTVSVVAAAIVVRGRVLAARRSRPADVAGGWELPGGKLLAGETPADGVVREVEEELGCTVAYVRPFGATVPVKPGYSLTAHLVELTAGEPTPYEHDALRWLSADDLDDVAWLPADRPFLGELRDLLTTAATESASRRRVPLTSQAASSRSSARA